MPRLRMLSAALLTALAAAACDGSGEHNVPDEANQGADSLAEGTATPSTPPPVGTVNPAAPSGPGSDSAAPGAVGGGPAQPPTPLEQQGNDSPREP